MGNFLRNQWYVAATSTEVTHKPLARTICNEPVVLFRTVGGEVGVLEDRCPHRRVPLSRGWVKGEVIQCAYHGSQFGRDGVCTGIPSQNVIPKENFAARSFPVIERYGMIFIWTGDAALADESLLPDFSQHTDGKHAAVHGYHYMKGNYLLIVDNLLDLTHLPYLHPGTLGAVNPDGWFHHQDVTVEGDVVKTSRAIRNSDQTPFVLSTKKFPGVDKLDRFQTSEFRAPGYLLVSIGFAHVEDKLEEMPFVHHEVTHALTPETDGTTHYFWTVVRSEALDNEAVGQLHYELTRMAFDEDAVMIEDQQKRLDSEGWEVPMVNLTGDAAGVAARRIVERKLREEEKLTAAA